MEWEYSNLTWPEVEASFSKTQLVIVPVGSVEQHGHHLGVGADWIQAWEIAKRVGGKSGYPVLPVLPYGISAHHKEYPGVISLSFGTYQRVITEVLDCLASNGVSRVVFVNGHGGNNGALLEAAKESRDKHGTLCAICTWWDILGKEKIFGHPMEQHAGYAETALTLASQPKAVRMEKARLTETRQVSSIIKLHRAGIAEYRDGIVRIPLRTIDVTDTGSMTEALPSESAGTEDYSMVTSEFAEELMKRVVDWLSSFVREFEKFELPPNERQYPHDY